MNRRTFFKAIAVAPAATVLPPSLTAKAATADLPKAKITRVRIYQPPKAGYGIKHNEEFPFHGSNLTFDATRMQKMLRMGYEIGENIAAGALTIAASPVYREYELSLKNKKIDIRQQMQQQIKR